LRWKESFLHISLGVQDGDLRFYQYWSWFLGLHTRTPIVFRGIPCKNIYLEEHGVEPGLDQQVISAKSHKELGVSQSV
jgi:hypothetical protein